MTYYLGVDLGTTYTAAATWRDGRVEIVSLGNRAPVVPSVLLIREDGEVLVGEAAARRATVEPQRVAREFKRRIGDPTPIIIGDSPWSADALTARLLRWVVDQVRRIEGGDPRGIAVSHPANWGDYKKDLLGQALALADLDGVATVTEPEAAAIHYASQERVETGSVIAVYDLGGGTFDAAVLRKVDGGWQVLGDPEGIERLGGVDFDEAVFRHVANALGSALDDLDPDDPAALAAVARLRHECVEAKEALSSDVDVTVPVILPTLQTEVRLTRAEFEAMVRAPLADSLTAMERALRSAGVEPTDVATVLLVGGSSRIPLVAQLVGAGLGRPVAVDAHPKHAIALGAAIVAAQREMGEAAAASQVRPTTEDPSPAASGIGAVGLAGAGLAGAAAAGALAGGSARDAPAGPAAAEATSPAGRDPGALAPSTPPGGAAAGHGAPAPTRPGEPPPLTPPEPQPTAAGFGADAATPPAGMPAGGRGAELPVTRPQPAFAAGDAPTSVMEGTGRLAPPGVPPAEVPVGGEPPPGPEPRSRLPLWLAIGGLAAVVVVLVAVAAARGDGEPEETPATTPTTTTATLPTTVTTAPPVTEAQPPATRRPVTTTTTEATTTTTEATTTTTEATTTTDTTPPTTVADGGEGG